MAEQSIPFTVHTPEGTVTGMIRRTIDGAGRVAFVIRTGHRVDGMPVDNAEGDRIIGRYGPLPE